MSFKIFKMQSFREKSPYNWSTSSHFTIFQRNLEVVFVRHLFNNTYSSQYFVLCYYNARIAILIFWNLLILYDLSLNPTHLSIIFYSTSSEAFISSRLFCISTKQNIITMLRMLPSKSQQTDISTVLALCPNTRSGVYGTKKTALYSLINLKIALLPSDNR